MFLYGTFLEHGVESSDDFVTSMCSRFVTKVLVGWDMPEKLLGLQCCLGFVGSVSGAEPWKGSRIEDLPGNS